MDRMEIEVMEYRKLAAKHFAMVLKIAKFKL
jgi:hypothetical protein